MKTVAKIIETYGGLDWLLKPGNTIRLENPPYQRLIIEYVGEGPRGMASISVAHYYEQNGDLMRDPEMVFEVNPDEDGPLSWKRVEWEPLSFQQDNFGIYTGQLRHLPGRCPCDRRPRDGPPKTGVGPESLRPRVGQEPRTARVPEGC